MRVAINGIGVAGPTLAYGCAGSAASRSCSRRRQRSAQAVT